MAEQQQTIPEELSQDESLKVLVGALNVAQRKGKFRFISIWRYFNCHLRRVNLVYFCYFISSDNIVFYMEQACLNYN